MPGRLHRNRHDYGTELKFWALSAK
jgi:hypothetical protein